MSDYEPKKGDPVAARTALLGNPVIGVFDAVVENSAGIAKLESGTTVLLSSVVPHSTEDFKAAIKATGERLLGSFGVPPASISRPSVEELTAKYKGSPWCDVCFEPAQWREIHGGWIHVTVDGTPIWPEGDEGAEHHEVTATEWDAHTPDGYTEGCPYHEGRVHLSYAFGDACWDGRFVASANGYVDTATPEQVARISRECRDEFLKVYRMNPGRINAVVRPDDWEARLAYYAKHQDAHGLVAYVGSWKGVEVRDGLLTDEKWRPTANELVILANTNGKRARIENVRTDFATWITDDGEKGATDFSRMQPVVSRFPLVEPEVLPDAVSNHPLAFIADSLGLPACYRCYMPVDPWHSTEKEIMGAVRIVHDRCATELCGLCLKPMFDKRATTLRVEGELKNVHISCTAARLVVTDLKEGKTS